MPVSGRPGRSSDQAGRESRISKKHGGHWRAPGRYPDASPGSVGCLFPALPCGPVQIPGRIVCTNDGAGFLRLGGTQHTRSHIASSKCYPHPTQADTLCAMHHASLVLERNTYGRSIVSFRSCHKRVLELPSRWVARIKDAGFLPFPRVLILEAGIWFHHEAATASEFRQLCGQPWESRRHDRRLVTTPNASREAKSHVVLFMSCISRNLPLPHKHLDGPRAIWPCCLGRWKTDWSGVLEMSERLKSQTSKPIYIHL